MGCGGCASFGQAKGRAAQTCASWTQRVPACCAHRLQMHACRRLICRCQLAGIAPLVVCAKAGSVYCRHLCREVHGYMLLWPAVANHSICAQALLRLQFLPVKLANNLYTTMHCRHTQWGAGSLAETSTRAAGRGGGDCQPTPPTARHRIMPSKSAQYWCNCTTAVKPSWYIICPVSSCYRDRGARAGRSANSGHALTRLTWGAHHPCTQHRRKQERSARMSVRSHATR